LHENQIGDKACEFLAPALKQMTGLKELELHENQIGDKGKVVIRKAWGEAENLRL
jgi:hypothetical protein